jgi:hypothetical protein
MMSKANAESSTSVDYIRNQTTQRAPERINSLNAWMKDYAAKYNAIYLDYYSSAPQRCRV